MYTAPTLIMVTSDVSINNDRFEITASWQVCKKLCVQVLSVLIYRFILLVVLYYHVQYHRNGSV